MWFKGSGRCECVTGHDKYSLVKKTCAGQHLSSSDVFISHFKPLPLSACVLLNGREGGEDQHCSTRAANNKEPGATTQVHIREYREEVIAPTAGRENKRASTGLQVLTER